MAAALADGESLIDVMAWNPQSRTGRPEGAEAHALPALYAYLARRFG